MDRFPETVAFKHVTDLNNAEHSFRRDHGRFALLRELGPDGADLIDGSVAAGLSGGYFFAVTPDGDSYAILAIPRTWNIDGRRSFFSDETRIVRQSWTKELASRSSAVAD